MTGISILLIFISIVISLLVMPIHIRVNPEEAGSKISKAGFFRLNIDMDGENLVSVILYVFFVRITWDPLQRNNRQPVKAKAPRKKKGFDLLKWNRMKFLASIAWQSIKKSRVKKFYLDLDTSNVIINANLYPVFELINERPRISLNINYSGNFALCLDVQNNLWTVFRIIIWNLLKRSFIFTKNKSYGIQS